MNKKKTGSIDDVTPEEWNKINRKYLDKIHGITEERAREKASRFVDGMPATKLNPDDFVFSFDPQTPGTLGHELGLGTVDASDFTISFPEPSIEYKFRENELIGELKDYIDSTYSQHYCQSGIQSSEVIVDRGRGIGFFLGNVDKYNARYGNKGTKDDHRKDLMKILHYALLALYVHDRENPKEYTVNVTD